MAKKKMWKTKIIIWSDYDPAHLELEDLARQAQSGDAYCSQQETEVIEDAENDPDWDGTEFFWEPEDSNDDDDTEDKDRRRGLFGPEYPGEQF